LRKIEVEKMELIQTTEVILKKVESGYQWTVELKKIEK